MFTRKGQSFWTRLWVLLVVFSLTGTQNVYALRPEATREGPVADAIAGDLGAGGEQGQRTWITGPYTPSNLLDAAAATQAELEQAGRERRIFAVRGDGAKDLVSQVAKYAAERTSPERQLPFWESGREEGKEKAQEKFVERLKKASEFHREAITSIIDSDLGLFGVQVKDKGSLIDLITKDTRHAIVYDESDNPFFYVEDLKDGNFIGVTASSGTYLYDGFRHSMRYKHGKKPQSIYTKLALIEGYMAIGTEEAKRAYRFRLIHEILELKSGSKTHREEGDEVRALIAVYDKKVYEAWKKKQADAKKDKEAKERAKVIAEVTSANLGKFFSDGIIPEDVVKAVEAGLAKLVEQGILVDYKVFANQTDLHIYTTRSNERLNKDGPFVVRNIIDTVVTALGKAEVSGLDFKEQVKVLEIRRTFKPLKFSERAAEPIAVISASNTYVGAMNLFLWRVLTDPMTVAGLTIDPTGDRGFMVEVWDSQENKTYLFDSITENKELRVLISEPGRYAITAAYPKKEHKIASNEPIVAVSVKRIFDDGKTPIGDHSPVAIVRTQSGLPAWGEALEGFAKGQPIVTYGGDKTRHMVAWMPVNIDEARTIKRGEAVSILTGFGYQSHRGGRIGEAEDVGGDKTLDVTRRLAGKWNRLLEKDLPRELWDIIKQIEPFMRPYAYDRDEEITALKAKWEAGEVLEGFERNPDPKAGETDPLLKDSLDVTLSTVKVDIGSRPGHFKPHSYTMQGATDVMEIAKKFGRAKALEYIAEANKLKVQMITEHLRSRRIQRKIQRGIINWKNVTKVLNDQLEKAWGKERKRDVEALGITRLDVEGLLNLLTQRPGVAKALVTELARQTLMDADVWAKRLHDLASGVLANPTPYTPIEDVLDYKVWHAGDDIQLTIAHRKGVEASDIHTLAFETFIYAAECAGPTKVYGYKQDILVNELVSGNVQGAGPGYAEICLKEGDSVVNLSADKTAPGAFTVPFLYWVRKAISDGRFQNGVIAEIWAIEGHQRTFLDLSNDEDLREAMRLLRAPELFAIKRLWSTKEKWDHKKPIADVLDRVIASASTERLVLVAGEYVGKDDPTMYILVGKGGFNVDDIINIWQHPLFALGFMRGSHMGPIMPDVLGKALPHRFDGPPPMCGWIFNGVTKWQGALGQAVDAFKGRTWLKKIQKAVNFFTDVIRALGFMPPHKVEGPDTEYTTAPKVKAALEAREKAKDAGNAEEGLFQDAVPNVLQQKAFLTIEAVSQVGNEILTQDAVRRKTEALIPAREGTYGLILSRELVFNEGLGTILNAMARNLAGRARVAVIATTTAEITIINKLNEGLTSDTKIIAYTNVSHGAQDLKANHGVTTVKYLVSESSEGLSVANVDEVVIIKDILAAIGEIEPLLSNPDAVEEFKLAVLIMQQA